MQQGPVSNGQDDTALVRQRIDAIARLLDLDDLHAAIVPTSRADVMRKPFCLALGALDQGSKLERVVRPPSASTALRDPALWDSSHRSTPT
jgi:hypothetical protein